MPQSPQNLSDIVVPENFTPYIQVLTEEKARLVQSGVIARSPRLDDFLAGSGLTINVPGFADLDADDGASTGADRVAQDIDTAGNHYTLGAQNVGGFTPANQRDPLPDKIGDTQEVAVRLSRNKSWTSLDLAAALAGEDPMDAIASRVSFYWTRRLQKAFIATWRGVIADNVANDLSDYQNDVSGASFVNGVTNFTAEAFIDAKNTMGDSMDDLSAMMVHSDVYARMQKNNLIDFIPDSRGEVMIPTFLNAEVIVDDGMPNTGGVYDSWLFGGGATMMGMGSPKVPTEVDRLPGAANGSGQEVLYSRLEWAIHPVGHAYQQSGLTNNGGPTNTTLATAGAWDRVYPERKQIMFARLVTRES